MVVLCGLTGQPEDLAESIWSGVEAVGAVKRCAGQRTSKGDTRKDSAVRLALKEIRRLDLMRSVSDSARAGARDRMMSGAALVPGL
jgi:hypothetical protein